MTRVLFVVAVALLVGAAAATFSSTQEKEYESGITFGFGRILSPEFQLLGYGEPDVEEEIRIQTEAAVIDSLDVAEATADAAPELRLTAGEIGARVNAQPIRGTLLVRVTARDTTAVGAARLAETYGQQYLRLRRTRESEQARKVEQALESRLTSLSDRTREGARGDSLRDQINSFAVFRRLGSGNPRLVEGAKVPGAAAQPKTTRNVLFGLLFGLAVGIGLVALRSEGRSRAAAAIVRRASTLTKGEPSRRE